MGLKLITAVTAGVLCLTACSPASTNAAPSVDQTISEQTATHPPPTDQTQAVLAAWDTVVAAAPANALIPTGELSAQSGDSDGPDAETNKLALLAGAIEYAAEPTAAASSGTVRIGNDNITFPIVDAGTAVELLKAAGNGQDCGGCRIVLENPQLDTMPLATAYGTASVPAWTFTVQGTNVRISRVAVQPEYVVTPPVVPPGAFSYSVFAARATGPATIQIDFTGSVPACRPNYTATVVESDRTFAVAITETYENGAATTCIALAYPHSLDVALAAPIGTRVLIDLITGLPVPVQPN